MTSFVRVRGFVASLLSAGVLLAAAPALAQPPPPSPPPVMSPPAPPPPAGPPPGTAPGTAAPGPGAYPPPPPRPLPQPGYGSYAYPNQRYWGPVYQPVSSYRTFSFSLGVGPGVLVGPSERELALSWNLFRLAFGVSPAVAFVVSFEGAGTSSVSPDTNEDSWLMHNVVWGGLQLTVLPAVYLRGGVGVGWGTESTDSIRRSSRGGLAVAGALGFEFVQSAHTALALELAGNVARYSRETWGMGGLNLALSFY